MVVTESGLRGTIGGGNLEYQAMAQARAILVHPPGTWRVQDYPLGPLLGQCCGGRVRLLVERLDSVPEGEEPYLVELGERLRRKPFPGGGRGPGAAREPAPEPGEAFIEPGEGARLPLLLFGAGHVGKAIASRTGGLPLHLAWFDSRPEAAETPGVALAAEEEMVAAARAADPDAAVVILTHDHGLDYRITVAALAGRARFVGLIGSQTKRARFVARLEKEGIAHGRLTCPIGLPGIEGKQPDVIAVALHAQLLMLERHE